MPKGLWSNTFSWDERYTFQQSHFNVFIYENLEFRSPFNLNPFQSYVSPPLGSKKFLLTNYYYSSRVGKRSNSLKPDPKYEGMLLHLKWTASKSELEQASHHI